MHICCVIDMQAHTLFIFKEHILCFSLLLGQHSLLPTAQSLKTQYTNQKYNPRKISHSMYIKSRSEAAVRAKLNQNEVGKAHGNTKTPQLKQLHLLDL